MRPQARLRSEGFFGRLRCRHLLMGTTAILLATNISANGATWVVGSANTAACTASAAVTVNTTGITGLIGSGTAAVITADGITMNLAQASDTAVGALSGSTISFNGSTIKTTATT